YALAQGNVLVGGAGGESGGSSVVVNQLSGGRISGGAIVEKAVPLQLGMDEGLLELQLKKADFTTAQRVVTAINEEFDFPVASALDSRIIQLKGPLLSDARVGFMAQVENVVINPREPSPKVVINSRTGSVVITSRVRLYPAAVAHGNLSVIIESRPEVSQPGPFSRVGETVVVPRSTVTIEQETGHLQMVEGANLSDVVNALNALGANTQDLMSIIEALKAVGSLRAELEIL
ncbi:MAG: flagellar basal body P-ring protein FlgI, partial [Porticoccus sp.]